MSFTGRFARDQDGAVLVEVTVLLPILIVFLFGAVGFLFAFYEWSAATKAVELGARIAAVSDPVASGLNSISTAVVSTTVLPGDPMPYFQVTCDGSAKTCTCTSAGGTCPQMGTYDQAAMNKIVCGRNNTSAAECDYSTGCFDGGGLSPNYFLGMCDLFPRIKTANVKIIYTQTGLGYADRQSGPVPTIAVELQNLWFQVFFVSRRINQALPTTMTGEVLSSSPQPPP